MPGGRPTKYQEDFITKGDAYLSEHQDEEVQEVVGLSVKGTELYKNKLKVSLPTIEGFALYLGVNADSLYEWAKEYSEFSETLRKIKTEQQKRLLDKGLSGDYNPTIAKLILSANHGMREKTDVTTDGKEIKGNTVVFKDFKDGTSS